MARKVSRARADQPQSNTALIVFLVFSILMNLGLGVFLYLSMDKVDQAEAKAKKAEGDRTAAENNRRAAVETFITLLRTVIGDTTVTNDQLNAMKEKLAGDATALAIDWYPNGKVWRELMGTSAANPGLIGPFTDSTGRPAISLMDKIRQLQTSLNESNKKLTDTTAALTKLTTDHANYQKEWNAAKYESQLKTAQESFQKELAAKLRDKDTAIADARQKIVDITNEVQKMFTDASNAQKAEITRLVASVEEVKQRLAEERRLENESRRQDRITAQNTPRARVVSYDARNNLAYIDIGSQMQVPLQLTFQIHGRDTAGVPSKFPKAEGEVVQVSGPQLSQLKLTRVARPDAERLGLNPETKDYWITDERQFVRAYNPVMKGDLLYNVVWKPFERTRVALVGEFDIDGDGTDDIHAFMSMLRNQGAQIDLYLDKANGFQPRGKLDFTTNVVVVGGLPVLTARGASEAPPANRGTELFRQAEEIQRDAIKKGIEIVTLPRFLSRMGYSVPRSLTPRTADNSVSSQTPITPPGGAPQPNDPTANPDEKKPEEPKKDEPKKNG
jgi:hypothetical protein